LSVVMRGHVCAGGNVAKSPQAAMAFEEVAAPPTGIR
jgi:hypothetical protein